MTTESALGPDQTSASLKISASNANTSAPRRQASVEAQPSARVLQEPSRVSPTHRHLRQQILVVRRG
jgi:hypothetical protein